MLFEEQVGTGAGVECGWDLGFDRLLSLAVGYAIVFALQSEEDADQNVGAVGGNGCHGGDVGKEEDAVDTRVGYVGELFKFFAGLIEGSVESGEKVAVELVFDACGNLFEALGAYLGHHASGF